MTAKTYDFRSDTVSRPTAAMRQAMANAEVGDDVYQDDPSVNALQIKAAKLLGKEDALFVTSGTMGNLLAVLACCHRGDEVIMGEKGHTFLHEAGGVSALGGVVIHTVPNQPDGTLDLKDLDSALRFPDIHEPISKMVILENTQNACGGMSLSVDYTNKVAAFARENGLVFHVDGARLFNAAIKLNVPAADLVSQADSVTFCLSKGLCCPVGSVLCGSHDFVERARRLRKMLGGGMRQAGILAAAGIYALDHMIDRLAEDHQRASQLAEGLANIPGLSLAKGSPYTNMVFVRVHEDSKLSSSELVEQLKKNGILVNESGKNELRFVTHHDVDGDAVETCLKVLHSLL
ncbi:MAG TPA: low-specificity L-threonine aldolase [Anaerolineaceae bacterium]|nr:low-specificity L-threonine aldolase [Anaerolineaceae bacterium]